MSIEVNCPTCGKAYNLNESLAGKKVRCKHCADTFPVDLDEVVPVRGDVPKASAVRSNHRRDSEQLDEVLPVRAASRRDEEDDEENRVTRPEPAKAGGFPWGWCLAGSGVCLVLLICGGFATAIFLIVYNIVQAANNVTANLNNMGNNPGFNPGPKPVTVTTAIADLQTNDFFRKKDAADWLANTPSNPNDQARVARALEPLLTDGNPFIRGAGAAALVNWADAGSVPALIRCLESNDGQTSDSALKALVRIRDPRGVPVIAKQLNNNWKRGAAANALQTLGPMCEAEVIQYVFEPDNGTSTEAQRLLKSYGTKDSAIVTQAIAALKSADPNRRRAAATWLGQTTAIEARRPEVSTALDPVLRDPDQGIRLNAVKAARVWATKENIPTLIKFIDDKFADPRPPEETYQAIELLIGFKDERAYWPIAHYASHWIDNAKGVGYLQQIGPAAEMEVAKRLTNPSNTIRQAAWKAIGIVGTKANLQTYLMMRRAEPDLSVQRFAQDALNTIAAR